MAVQPVTGIRELNFAFALAGETVAKSKHAVLKHVAGPVRRDAETLAVARIRKIGGPWSRMRVGVTPGFVYVAPQKRGTRDLARKRRNLAPLLRTRSMEPALEQNRAQVTRGVQELLDRMERQWGRRR